MRISTPLKLFAVVSIIVSNFLTITSSLATTFPSRAYSQRAKLFSPQPVAASYFGEQIAVDGDTLVVAAKHDSPDLGNGPIFRAGSVYVYTKNNGIWNLEAKLVASDAEEEDEFGDSVAIYEDTIVVGARAEDPDTGNGPIAYGGSVYIFVRNGNLWSEQTKLTLSDASAFDEFGDSVAIYEDIIAVGTPGEDPIFGGRPVANMGSVYVFLRNGTTWNQHQKFTVQPFGSPGLGAGHSIVLEGDIMVVGGYRGNSNVFRLEAGIWIRQTQLPEAFSMDISGNTIVIGNSSASTTLPLTGYAEVFSFSEAGWISEGSLIPNDVNEYDNFGASVAISGDTIITSKPNKDLYQGNEIKYSVGSVYVFTREGTSWTQQVELFPSDAEEGDHFGAFVTISGENIFVGAPYQDPDVGNGPVESAGSAYIFSVAPSLGEIIAPLDPIPVNTGFSASADFVNPNPESSHSANWNWGDGNFTTGTVSEDNGSGSTTGSYAYPTPGVYTLTLMVLDNEGDFSTAEFRYIVVYDPNGGFVTGGGWINSPVGAYTLDSSLSGKANFGFVSKYQNGSSIPTGNTEFSFHIANFNFQSTLYQWLVIGGAKAQYKGSGTINGSGDYGFILTAIDGQINGGGGTDKFRIKIWDKGTGEIIYDNQIGSSDSETPTTTLGGGSIVIHKK